jgi:hypothetical protein
MRKLMVLAAMLAMMMVAAAPAMAQTTEHDDGDLVDFPACFPFCEDISFEDGFLLVSLDEGVSDDIDIDNDSDDNDSNVDFDDNDSDFDSDDNGGNNNHRVNNNGGNGGRN